MPVEIMLLPKWFPFHIDKISYWARTVIVPLLVLQALKPKAKNPKGITIDELFLKPPQEHRTEVEGAAPEVELVPDLPGARCGAARGRADVSRRRRGKRAIDKAVEFVTERLNGEDGLGAIFPAMANSAMMYQVLGYPSQHPDYVAARTFDRQAADDQGRRSLLPAVRVAGVGHRRSSVTRCSRSARSLRSMPASPA